MSKKEQEKKVEIPESAQGSLRSLLAQRRQLDNDIQIYIRALQDTLDIEGDGWSLDLQAMTFTKQSPNGKVKEDVVGTTTGNSTN